MFFKIKVGSKNHRTHFNFVMKDYFSISLSLEPSTLTILCI